MKLYTLRDIVTNTYGQPFSAINHADAKRKVATAYNQLPNASDLELYYLADFNENTGNLCFGLPDTDDFVRFAPEMLCACVDIIGGGNA